MKHGAEAAQTAVRAASRAIRQAWRISPADREPSPSLMLAAAFTAASSRLSLRGLARGFASGSDGLCTTLIVTIAAAGGFHYGYIGDGSICLLRASGELKALLHPHKADPAVQIILSACLGPTLRGTPVFGCVEREPSDLLAATTDGIADRVLPAFYSRTVPRQARRLKGDLNAAAQRVLQILAQHRDDTGFSFDDNMTLGLLGDGSPPHNADQGAEPTAPTKSAEPAPPTAEMT